MAALNKIARNEADTIREGIAWLIVWKTGRSWHAESVHLNTDDDTFELEDLDMVREVLEQDPGAVMLNGYYCGHFGEDMTAAEIEAGIRWHYENGYNLLKDSTAFPPEPMERPADLPADIPWYGAAAGADQSKDSKEWEAIHTPDGDPVYFNPREGQIFVEPTEAEDKDYDGVRFVELEPRSLDIPEQLIKLGLFPPTGHESDEYFWIDNEGERCVFRGGGWGSGASAGVFFLYGASRGPAGTNIGFRSAYVRYSDDSDTLDNLDDEATDLSDAPEEIKEQIKANDEELKARAAFPLPETLPEIVRYALARQLAKIYAAAGGKDVDSFTRKAYEATDKELQQSAALAGALVHVNIATDTMIRAMEQVLAATSALTRGKEAGDHE